MNSEAEFSSESDHISNYTFSNQNQSLMEKRFQSESEIYQFDQEQSENRMGSQYRYQSQQLAENQQPSNHYEHLNSQNPHNNYQNFNSRFTNEHSQCQQNRSIFQTHQVQNNSHNSLAYSQHLESGSNQALDTVQNNNHKFTQNHNFIRNPFVANEDHQEDQVKHREAKHQVVQKLIQETGYMHNLQQVVNKKLMFYKKKGMSQGDAINKVINKLLQKKNQTSFCQPYSSTAQQVYDPEIYAKLKKMQGFSVDETIKALQLKKEIDNLLEQRIHQQDSPNSSEDSSSHDHQYLINYSPRSKERLLTEKKYMKKFQKVMDTMIERVDNSSGSCSSDEKYKVGSSKKRKYQEYLDNLQYKQFLLSQQQDQSSNQLRVPLYHAKRRQLNEQSQSTASSNGNVNSKKRSHKEFIRQLHHRNNDINSGEEPSRDNDASTHNEIYYQQKAKRFKNE